MDKINRDKINRDKKSKNTITSTKKPNVNNIISRKLSRRKFFNVAKTVLIKLAKK